MSLLCKNHHLQHSHICCSPSCIQLLCAKCLASHISDHKLKGDWPELFTLDEMRGNCREKLESSIQKCNSLITEISQRNDDERALQNKINLEQLKFYKRKFISFIEEYFQAVEDFISEESNREGEKFNVELFQMKESLQNLQNLNDQIDTQESFDLLINVFQTNYSELMEQNKFAIEERLQEKFIVSFSEIGYEKVKNEINYLIKTHLIQNSKFEKFKFESKLKEKHNSFHELTKDQSSKLRSKEENQSNIKEEEKLDKKYQDKTNSSNFAKENESMKSIMNNSLIKIESKKSNDNRVKEVINAPPSEKMIKSINTLTSEKMIRSKNEFLPPIQKTIEEIKSDTQLKQSQLISSSLFKVSNPDYYVKYALKTLHFFEDSSKNLYILDLEEFISSNYSSCFKKTVLNIDFLIPPKHRSISNYRGEIYLIGGLKPKEGLSNIMIFNNNTNSLEQRKTTRLWRDSFGVCFLYDELFIVGGYDEFGNKLSSCEKYDCKNNEWSKLASMNQKTGQTCLSIFQEKYIYKFGGESNQQICSQIIEKYDIAQNKWNLIKAVSDSNVVPTLSRLAAALQINENIIIVFGGYYEKNDNSTNQCYLLQILNEENIICNVNEKCLPICGGFWNSTPIIMDKKLFCLQNVADPNNKNISLGNQRNILMFNEKEWKKLD